MIKAFDYIVVGGGLSGLYTAYNLAKQGEVALVARDQLEDSNSYFAQGGMAAVTDKTDTPKDHFDDTIEAGRGLCIPSAVKVLVEEAPKRVNELIAMGMRFDAINGNITLGLEGGHHHHRILHAGGDATGRLVTSFMIDVVRKIPNITIFDHHLLTDLKINDGVCQGITTYDTMQHLVENFYAKATVLATGGTAALYSSTTNPPTALGDGIALALTYGVQVRDLEFIQFHPTALSLEGVPPFLISEAVRGEGAQLYNTSGKRFMLDKHPMAELAPRDVVARSIFEEIQHSNAPYVYLSLSHLPGKALRERFPTIAKHCDNLEIDFTDKIPVAPAAHYTVGGIATDLNGKTTINNLFAVGEIASTGTMGANRLASNSLIECLVMGYRIAYFIHNNSHLLSPIHLPASTNDLQHSNATPTEHSTPWNNLASTTIQKKLGDLMMREVGIVRNYNSLNRAIEGIESLKKELINSSKEYNYFTTKALMNRLNMARWITKAALERTESRGVHFRDDYPTPLPNEQAYHTIIEKEKLKHELIGKTN